MTDLLAGTTPGPWEVEGDLDPSGVGSRPWVGRLHENRFSALSCGDTPAEAQANAKLIAAAPTLATENAALRSLCAELVGALDGLVHAVCGETGFANAVRGVSGTAYPWPALDLAEAKAETALARAKDLLA